MENTKDKQIAIQKYLDAKGLTVQKWAKQIGVSASTVSDWKNGKTKFIRPDHWIKIENDLKPFLSNNSMIENKIFDIIKKQTEEKQLEIFLWLNSKYQEE